jgi:hypothetical protein
VQHAAALHHYAPIQEENTVHIAKTLTPLAALAAAAVALAPSAAKADWGIRLGGEVPLATHVNDGGSYSISDSVQPAADLLILKGPSDFIGFGLEGHIGFASTGSLQRTGSSVGPAVILNVPVLPLFVRASLPIRIEPDPVAVGLRLGAGFKFNVPFVGIYLEATADMPFAGKNVGGSDAKFLGSQVIGVGAGVEIRI